MYETILILPFWNFILLTIFGYHLTKKQIGLLFGGFYGAMSILCWFGFYKYSLTGYTYYQVFGNWINIFNFDVLWALYIDSVTAAMLLIVVTVASLVHVYSFSYMYTDPGFTRFISYISLFTGFMLVLISSENLIVLFLGWEGVGLCSYLLINFWSTRFAANKAALKAILLNRIGDLGFLIGTLLVYDLFKTVKFLNIFALIPFLVDSTITINCYSFHSLTVICLFFFLGTVGKSAQLGLHTWLPDAMEGPTPVSALIHAATMVTAGLFLIIRLSPLFNTTDLMLIIIMVVGSLTAFIAGLIGVVQNDIKKIIAYSTCSQLGYMLFICGAAYYSLSLFHLVNHAFFKALLFLSAGSVVHSCSNEQDIRRMGGLLYVMPVTYLSMVIGSFALMGIPYFSGFYSKDLILEFIYGQYTFFTFFAYWLGVAGAFCTAFYSTRLLYFVFWTRPNGYKIVYYKAHESDYFILVCLIILSLFSILFGYWWHELFIGLGTDFFSDSIQLIAGRNYIDFEFLPWVIKLIPLFFSLGGVCLFFFFSSRQNFLFDYKFYHQYYYVYKLLVYKFYFDLVYNYIGYKFLKWGKNISYIYIDKMVLEFFGPEGVIRGAVACHQYLIHIICTGRLYHMFWGVPFIFIVSLNYLVYVLIFGY